MTAPHLDAGVHDPDLPAASVLFGPAAAEVVAPAVAEEGGVIHALEPEHASYRPGRRILVSYDAEVEWPDGSLTGETLVAFGRPGDLPEGALPVEVQGMIVGVWRLPNDPYLPGLERALAPDFVREVLDRLGAPPGQVDTSMRGYWPRDRAVVMVTTAASDMKLVFTPGKGLAPAPVTRLAYLKVVRPGQAEPIYRRHRELAGSLPVPACYQWLEEHGILVLEARSGMPLYEWVQEGRVPAPGPDDLLDLLERLRQVPFDAARAETNRETARRYAPVLQALLPDYAARIERFIERLGEDSPEPLVTTHGDFHEYQVLVEDGRISGLLDVDDVAPGQRADDLSMMVARFLSFAPFEENGRQELENYAYELLRAFGQVCDPEELHVRVASVLFARATSPFRNQEPNWRAGSAQLIEMAEEWLERPVADFSRSQ